MRAKKSVAMENRLWPMRELLAELLLEQKQPQFALKEFEASLKEARNAFAGSRVRRGRRKCSVIGGQLLPITRRSWR
jgi:hypothetical protein